MGLIANKESLGFLGVCLCPVTGVLEKEHISETRSFAEICYIFWNSRQ